MDQPARLSSNLLARKGVAQPVDCNGPAAPATVQNTGFGSRRRALLSPAPEEPLSTLIEHSPPSHAVMKSGMVEVPKSRRVALTVRLDPTRHTKLRILAARHDRTSQDLMIEALDGMLEAAGETCPCLRRDCSGNGR